MKSLRIRPESRHNDIINDTIESMKKELAISIKEKSLIYSFDFDAGRPANNNSIFWSKKN